MEFKKEHTEFTDPDGFLDRARDFYEYASASYFEESAEPEPALKLRDVDKKRILRAVFRDKDRRQKEKAKSRTNDQNRKQIQQKEMEAIKNERNMDKRSASYTDPQISSDLFKDAGRRYNPGAEDESKKDLRREDQRKTSAETAAGSRKEDPPNRADPETRQAAQKAQVRNLIQSGKLKTKDKTGGAEKKQYADDPTPVPKEKGLLATALAVLASNITIVIIIMIVSMVFLPVTLGAFVSMDVVSRQVERMMQGFGGRGQILAQGSLSEEEIDEIVAECGAVGDQETVIRYALSKVGLAYSQTARTSGAAFDCSSLAYYSCLAAGKDISYGTGYPPTAAAAASKIYSNGTVVSSTAASAGAMQPGDLIFYGGRDNGRYLGIYHVAIYLGNGKVVEALNERYGVVYGTLRTKNAILVLRP